MSLKRISLPRHYLLVGAFALGRRPKSAPKPTPTFACVTQEKFDRQRREWGGDG